jgi:glycosyltransferase involved in cell wall biosynthesis
MNIVLLSRFFDFRGTGVSRVATEVAKSMENKHHNVTKIYTKGHSLYSYFFYTAAEIPMRLPRKNVDVYHALATMEAMWLPRNKSIATILDLFTTTNPDKSGAGMGYSKWKLEIGRRYFDFGSRLAAQCRFIVCISDKTKQEVMECLGVPENRIRVIHLGIADDLNPTQRNDNVFRVGTLNQLDKRKRIDLLVKAFKKSRIIGNLVIAGGGPDKEMLAAIAGADSRIRFPGIIPDGRLQQFYNNLDVFCSPTSQEGWGLSLVEAMSCGIPCVVLQDALLPEEIKRRCVVTDDLQGTLEYWKRPEQSVLNNNRLWAKGFTWNKCADEYEKLYREIRG